jgi:hypothetical protein
MPSAISRGPVTNRVIAELEVEGFPVGDNQAPTVPFGWQGEPNSTTSTFIPWMSVAPLTGQSQRTPGAMGDTGTEWSLPYSVFYSGMSREHVEALSDRVRNRLTNITREGVETDTGRWRIMKISCHTVGGVNRVGSTFPDYFTQSDTYDVWVSTER